MSPRAGNVASRATVIGFVLSMLDATSQARADALPASSCLETRPAAGGIAEPGCERRRQPATDHVPDVASLRTPESPAFLVLGFASSEVQRPTAPTTFKLSASGGMGERGAFSLLKAFAVEVSPFRSWGLEPEEIIEEDWEALYRNLSFSLATGPKDVEVTVDERTTRTVTLGRLAMGARVTLFPGLPTRGAERCARYIRDQLERAERESYYPVADVTLPERAELNDSTFERCTADIYARQGPMADAAGAHLISAPDGELGEDTFTTTTFWLTVGYVFELGAEDPAAASSELSILALGRHQYEYGSPTSSHDRSRLLDAGGRVAYAVSRYAMAVEGTYRRRLPDLAGGERAPPQNLWRVALSVDYRLDNGLWFIGTFGKDFGVEEDDAPLIGLANVQWNFDLDRGVHADRTVTQ